jgi:uncharacterized tellurite resistance protein B-like protein
MFNLYQSQKEETQKKIVSESLAMITKRLEIRNEQVKEPAAVISWIKDVFENAVKLSQDKNLELGPPAEISLPIEITAFTVQTVIRLLTTNSDPHDNGLYYLNDIGSALGIHHKEMRNLLDKEFDKLRYEFTIQLKEELDSEKLYWCALILMKIICADGQIHPAEKLYFDIISELINSTTYSLDSLKKAALGDAELPKLELAQTLAQSMLKYVVTIAMCDGEYVGQESQFIKKAAKSLGIAPSKIDGILQPVASSFMVLESLFPKETAAAEE